MRYLSIILACAAEVWAMDREKLNAIVDFLSFKADGGDFTREEIEARITNKRAQQVAKSGGQLAVLPVFGVLGQRMNMMEDISGGTSTEQLATAFRAMLADPETEAVVMQFDSPGGMVYGIAEFAQEIMDSRGTKPIVAQIDSTAASAAYWLASAADEIVVTPGGRGGSIGVYTIHEDLSKMLEKLGVQKTMIASSPQKAEGNPYEPLGEEARAHIQERVHSVSDMFVRGVAAGRGVSVKTVNDTFGQGRTFGAAELVRRGMADRVGSMRETLDRFGIKLNPSAKPGGTRAEAAELLVSKLRTGERPTARELENGLKGLAGLSNAEAVRAVRLLGGAQGEPGAQTDQAAAQMLAEIRERLDGIPKLLKAQGA